VPTPRQRCAQKEKQRRRGVSIALRAPKCERGHALRNAMCECKCSAAGTHAERVVQHGLQPLQLRLLGLQRAAQRRVGLRARGTSQNAAQASIMTYARVCACTHTP
jgi:hypothetical protein